jgi:hypothetical protein
LMWGEYVVQIAWEHLARTIGEKSEPVSIECMTGGFSITPPTPPANMAGWHVFIAEVGGKPVRQNPSTIGADTLWIQSSPMAYDLPATEPSGPDYYVRQPGQLVRR